MRYLFMKKLSKIILIILGITNYMKNSRIKTTTVQLLNKFNLNRRIFIYISFAKFIISITILIFHQLKKFNFFFLSTKKCMIYFNF